MPSRSPISFGHTRRFIPPCRCRLVQDNGGKLSVVKTSNADVPITDGLKPLLVIDVWEHSVRACM